MKIRKIVNSEQSLSEAIGVLRENFHKRKFITMIIDWGKARTLSQNALSHTWYYQVSAEEKEYLPGEIKCLCKLHFGLPILRHDDDDFNELCARVIDVLPYEDQVRAMEYMPVTSIMTTAQLSEYLNFMQMHYASRVDLRFPEDN